MREAAIQYMDSTTLEQDALWQLMSPEICAQRKIDTSVPGAVERLYTSMREDPLLSKKGEKVARLLFSARRRVSPPGPWLQRLRSLPRLRLPTLRSVFVILGRLMPPRIKYVPVCAPSRKFGH